MDKIDMKKKLKDCYTAKAEPKIIEVPEIKYIAFDGQGNPNSSQDFQAGMGVLYGLAYTLKFMCKENEMDFIVMPLEGIWWTDDMDTFSEDNKDNWNWTVMIAVPDYTNPGLFEQARERLVLKKDVPQLEKGYFTSFNDGLSAQLMHIGPYNKETENINRLHDYIDEKGYRRVKKHREIYLSNPQRTAPEKMKTIIRHPVEKI